MIKKLICIFTFTILITGCKDAVQVKSVNKDSAMYKAAIEESLKDTNKIKTGQYKGMYSVVDSIKLLTVCDTRKSYRVAEGSETAEIDQAFASKFSGKKSPGLYTELEGFFSEQSKLSGKGMDSVFIITKILRFNDTLICR